MAKSHFFCGRNAFFSGIRFYSAVLSSQVLQKCTDLDLSLLYNLILGTYSKFARKNNFLSLCARRSHRRAALLRTLRWLSKFSKKIRRGCRKKQVGVLKRRVFRQCRASLLAPQAQSRDDGWKCHSLQHTRERVCTIAGHKVFMCASWGCFFCLIFLIKVCCDKK